MTCKQTLCTAMMAAAFAACGNYSNEDLEFMNAVPARQDLIANIKTGPIVTTNEAELAKDTHAVVNTFNGALEFLKIADVIRSYQPTSRIQDGRIWGPIADNNHPGWQWRFVMTKDPAAPGRFNYTFQEQPIGSGDTWYPLINGWFVATGGVRRGMGHFTIQTDPLSAAGFQFALGADGSLLKQLDIDYSTADYPVSVVMHLELYPKAVSGDTTTTSTIDYTYDADASGQGQMQFVGTDSTGKSISVVSSWLATGQGRAEATAADPSSGVSLTWTECWDTSFVSVYDNKPWATAPDPVTTGDPSLCPAIPSI